MTNILQPTAQISPPRNAVSIFLAHFHVRRGNEIIWQKGDADLNGVEWKVIPSGSHATEQDIIYFEAAPHSNGTHRIGVSAFRNKRIDDTIRSSAATQTLEVDDQRGARMIAVGAIFDCGHKETPWSLLNSTIPHLPELERLAKVMSEDPTARGPLEKWLDAHRRGTETVQTPSTRDLSGVRSAFVHDPLFQLPAITNALGPLLPSLLKRLLLPRSRLLIYLPGGVPTYRAAGIAFALAELAYAACQSDDGEAQCPFAGSARGAISQHALRIRGILGLHDLAALQEESNCNEEKQMSWIAWTTDKILLEKCQLYEAVLDLSPMVKSAQDATDLFATPTSLPLLLCTKWMSSKDGKRDIASLQKQTWTTREFAVFRGLDEQASINATSSRRVRRRSSVSLRSDQTKPLVSTPSTSPTKHLQHSPSQCLTRQRTASTFLSFLRFWLSSLWILPYRLRLNLRDSYGYVPLGIRSDGGVRASIMLLPDDYNDEYDSSEAGDDSHQSLTPAVTTRNDNTLSAPSINDNPPRTLSSEGAQTVVAEEEEIEAEDDPILAAVGATHASVRRRRTRSAHSASASSAAQDVANVVSRQLSVDGGSAFSTSHNLNAGQRSGSTAAEREALQEARESLQLSLSTYETWSLWIREVVVGIQDLVKDRSLEDQSVGSCDNVNQNSLLSGSGSQGAVHIPAADLYELHLSATNLVDTELITYLASTVTDREVAIDRSWWCIPPFY